MRSLLIYGAGGFGTEVLDVAVRQNNQQRRWKDILFVDDITSDQTRNGVEILRFEQLKDHFHEFEFVIALGEPDGRRILLEKLDHARATLGQVIDPSCQISPTAQIAEGVVITPFCSISSNVNIGRNVCINTMSIVGHGVTIEDSTVISSMVNLGGKSVIGANSYLGMGALIKEKISIGSNTIIGMGSVVYQDIQNEVIALGNPARVMRANSDKKVF